MEIKKRLIVVLSTLLLATTGAMVSMPAHADTPGQERRGDRRDGRDVRQEGRQDGRATKRECKKGDEKTRAECRQDNRGGRKDNREAARETRKGGGSGAEEAVAPAPAQPPTQP